MGRAVISMMMELTEDNEFVDKQCCLLKISVLWMSPPWYLNWDISKGISWKLSPLFLCKANTLQSFQANTSLQDGCDSHSCRVNERGEFIWERRITGCPPFDARRCLAEGVSSETGPVSRFPNGLCHVSGNFCVLGGKPQPSPNTSAKLDWKFLWNSGKCRFSLF